MKWCPVHEFEHWQCSDACLPNRQELEELSHALNRYWDDWRKRRLRRLEKVSA